MVKYLLGPKGTGIAKVYILTKNAKNPERFIQFLDWTYSDDREERHILPLRYQGQNYTESDGQITWDPKATVMRMKSYNTKRS